MDDAMTEKLKELFESYTGTEALSVKELPASGSNRRYFRISGGYTSLIGVLGTSVEENKALCITFKRISVTRCYMIW